MQTISRILLLDGNIGKWVDDFGKANSSPPEIAVGVRVKLQLDLRQPERHPQTGKLLAANPEEITSDAYYFALDSDYLQSTDPKLIVNDLSVYSVEVEDEDTEGNPITTNRVYLETVLPNTAVPSLLNALTANPLITLNGEIGGYSAQGSSAECDFITQFSIVIRNRVYLGGTVPEEIENDPEYLTRAEVLALIAAATRPDAASLSIGTVTSGNEASAEITGTAPNQTLNLVLEKGADGRNGEDGRDGQDGQDGQDGITPHIGPNGNWWNGDDDLGIPARGEPGEDLSWDESGTVQERDAYAARETGFTYAATETDSTAGTTTLYIWKKRSDDWGDWTDPVIITYYSKDGKDGTNAALIEPIEFTSPDGNKDYLYFSLSAHQAATIAAVCIDTDEGEQRLPYYSAQGIRKIVRTTDGTVRIYFGSQVPAYTTGRIYFAQGYVPNNNSGSDTPSWQGNDEVICYGYIPAEDGASLNSVADITQEMIDAAVTAGTVTRVEDTSLEEEITVPRYGWLFVAVPNDSSFVAKKDDGFGNQIAFAETNGVTGTAAANLKFYGEFSLVSATHTIYVSGTGSASGGNSNSGSGNSSSGGNSNSGSGTSAPASQQIIELTSTAISPADNSVYYHDLESGDAFTLDLEALQDRQQWYFELDLVQPATPVSFTFPSGIVWGDGLNFDPDNPPPACNEGSKIYSIIFRLRNFRGRKYVLANLALVESVPDSGEEESEEGEE